MSNAIISIKKLRPATLIAILALFLAIGGTATAASGLINGKDIKKGTVATKQLKNKSITKAKLKPATIKALKGQAGPQGIAGATGATGAAGTNGVDGADGIVSPLIAEDQNELITKNKDKQILQLDVPAGGYLVTYNVDLHTQTAGSTTCVLAANEVAFDISQVFTQFDDRMNFTLTGIAPEGTNSLEVRCLTPDAQFTYFENAKLIATPIG